MKSNITITNSAGATVIDIEGVIGVPEALQFSDGASGVSTYPSVKALLEAAGSGLGGEIVVNIRSTGGSVRDALLIYDYLAASGAAVTTRCYGYAASAATIIAQAASPGRREVSANSLYLIHNCSCEAEGNSAEIGSTLDMLAKTDERIAAIYASVSGRDAALYRDLMNENTGRGRWLSPEEVVDYGLADKIIEKSRITRRDRSLLRNLALPPVPGDEPDGLLKRVWEKITETLDLRPPAAEPAAEWTTEPAAEPTAGPNAELAEAPSANPAAVPAAIVEPAESIASPADAADTTEDAPATGRAETVTAAASNSAWEPEADNPLRRAVGPTRTRPREDPPVHETRLTNNQQAYLEDLYRLKNI